MDIGRDGKQSRWKSVDMVSVEVETGRGDPTPVRIPRAKHDAVKICKLTPRACMTVLALIHECNVCIHAYKPRQVKEKHDLEKIITYYQNNYKQAYFVRSVTSINHQSVMSVETEFSYPWVFSVLSGLRYRITG